MSKLDDAVQKFNDATSEWAKAAEKLREARQYREDKHEQTGEIHKSVIKDPSPANIEGETQSYERERAAEQEVADALKAYEAAAQAFMQALAEFQTALALSAAR